MSSIDDEIDEILDNFIAIYKDTLNGRDHEAVDQAKKSIVKLIERERDKPTQIMGRTLDEVCEILIMLDTQELAEMKLTMSNLREWQELLVKEQKEVFEKNVSRQLARIKEQSNE